MKKRDFKKLMLLGISAGALVASQAGAELNNTSGTFLAGGCGGKGGCNGYAPRQTNHGCASMPNYNNNSNNGAGKNGGGQNGGGQTAYQTWHSCSSHQPYYNATPSYPPSQGCASYQPQISNGCASRQSASNSCSASHGCGGSAPNAPSQPKPSSPTAYTQWSNTTGGFTADAAKPANATPAPQQHGGELKESDLLSPQSPLNQEAKMIYQGLDQEGKALALKLINQSADKNQAVKIAAQKMAEKRAGAAPVSR